MLAASRIFTIVLLIPLYACGSTTEQIPRNSEGAHLIPTRLGIDRFCPRSCSDAFELTVDIEEACPSPAAGIHDVLVGVVDPGIEEVVPEELKEVLDRV